MKKNEGGMEIVIAVVVLLLLVGGVGFYFFNKKSPQNNSTNSTQDTNGDGIGDNSSQVIRGDIDKDGVAGETDSILVRASIGCKKEDVCWNKTIGKTKDGDNPLYVFDLDLNSDGEISDADLAMIGK